MAVAVGSFKTPSTPLNKAALVDARKGVDRCTGLSGAQRVIERPATNQVVGYATVDDEVIDESPGSPLVGIASATDGNLLAVIRE